MEINSNPNEEETILNELKLLKSEYYNLIYFKKEGNYTEEFINYKNKLLNKIENLEKIKNEIKKK